MILRRIANAFSMQDWFTVVIETLIVVLESLNDLAEELLATLEVNGSECGSGKAPEL